MDPVVFVEVSERVFINSQRVVPCRHAAMQPRVLKESSGPPGSWAFVWVQCLVRLLLSCSIILKLVYSSIYLPCTDETATPSCNWIGSQSDQTGKSPLSCCVLTEYTPGTRILFVIGKQHQGSKDFKRFRQTGPSDIDSTFSSL
jgi:hypothetical protein